MYSCGPPHMDVQKQDDQHELTYSNYVRTLDVTLKTCRRWCMIGRSGEKGSGMSVLAARHDDDDDDIVYNSHVTCSNSSFSLTMVTPTSHFFAFHWLCCLFPIGYLPKPGSVAYASATITEFNHVRRSRWYSDIFDRCTCFQHPPYSQ